jgi:hypothetical protein
MRDDKWLFGKLDEVWDHYFNDVPQHNDVRIVWGRRARRRLGSIKHGENHNGIHKETVITINALFKDPNIPDYVIEATIAHELSHYVHGFGSPFEQRYSHPHKGGVVQKEMKARGLAATIKKQKAWLKENWVSYLDDKLPAPKRKRRIILKWF